jgi:CTP synthase (UTP-ammonia lyase)
VIEAVKYSSYVYGCKPKLTWISSSEYEKDSKKIKELNPDVIMCHTNDTLSSIRIAQKY